jgi:uncharacterized protein (DUF1697 family)
MADLRELLTQLGYADVRTHLQSGNVVLRSASSPNSVVSQLDPALKQRFGFDVPVIVRTGEEMALVVDQNPLGEVATDPSRYVVTFLPVTPDAAAVASLDGKDFGPERSAVLGREVYQWCPNGQQNSLLLTALSKSGVTQSGTARNWRTVTRLAQMLVG